MTEIIGYRIVVDDKDTAKLQTFGRTATTEMGKAEAAGKRMGAEVARSTNEVTRATAGLGTTMEKGRAAAFALAGGLSGMGQKAAIATTALSQLVVAGLNPLGIALTAAAVGIGVLVSKHQEATEAAKAQEAALKDLLRSSRETQAGVRGILDPAGARRQREAELVDEIARIDSMARSARAQALQTAENKRRMALAGMPFTVGNPAADAEERRLKALQGDALLAEFGVSDSSSTFSIERGKVMEKLAALQGSTLAEATKAATAAEAAARETFNLARAMAGMPTQGGTLRFAGQGPTVGGYSTSSNPELNRAFGVGVPSSDATMTEIVARYGGPSGEGDIGAEYLARFQKRDPSIGRTRPSAGGGFLPLEASGRLDQYRQSGRMAADAYIGGMSDVLTNAAFGRGLNLKEFGMSMAEMTVRGFTETLLSAAFKNQMTSAFTTMLAQLGSALGIGGAGSGFGAVLNGGGRSGTGDLGVTEILAGSGNVAPVISEDVLRAASPSAAHAFVMRGSQGAGRRGARP